MDKKRKNNYIQAARRISRWNPARQAVKKAAKIDKALYKCSKCGCLCYEGKSSVTFYAYKEKYAPTEVRQEFADVDHKVTVVPLSGWDDWNGFYERLECDESDLQVLCRTVCHKEKSSGENKKRWAAKYGKKKV